jgi:hypothetical protein
MAEFLVISGTAYVPDTKGIEKKYKGGDTVESDMNLDIMFPHKFVRADQTDRLTTAQSRKMMKKAGAPRKRTPAKVGEDDFNPAQVDEERRREVEERDSRGASPKKGARDEDGGEDGDDVTDTFTAAKTNELKVFHVKNVGYTAFDGKKRVNQTPIKTKPKMEEALLDYIGD